MFSNPISPNNQIARTIRSFFASLPDGEAFRKGRFLSGVPAWAAGTTYYGGDIVYNTTTNNCYAAMGGTTGVAAVAPTGTGDGLIADGTLKWIYIGLKPTASAADADDVPALSWAATHASTTVRINPNPIAGNGFKAFRFSGGDMSDSVPLGGGTSVTGNKKFTTVEFETDAPIISFNTHGNSIGPKGYHLSVNGVPYSAYGSLSSALRAYIPAPGTPGGLIIDFSNKPRKRRRIKVLIGTDTFTGISVSNRDMVWTPENDGYRLWLEGASSVEGSTPTNGFTNRLWRLSGMLGCEDIWSSAVGGTGYLYAGGGSTYQDRVADLIAHKPDILYCTTYNWDLNAQGYTSAQRKAAYELYLNTLLNELPNIQVIISGGTAETEVDMSEFVAAYRNNRVVFNPSFPDTNGYNWFTGDGTIDTAGTVQGNTQVYLGDGAGNFHHNVRGFEYMQDLDYMAMVRGMKTLSSQMLY